jgi:hypothetical protein
MAAWLFLALSAVPLAPEPIVPTLTLVWHDSTRCFPSVGLDRLKLEMETLFREHGLSVRFHAAAENEDLQNIPEPRINAVVLPGEARSRTPANAMAAALGERGRKYGIFVYFESVRRTLGYQGHELSPRHTWELSRALARIVAHEVVHALAPARGHADSGLMTEKLTRKLLLADRIELDESSLALVVTAMQEWRFPARTSAQPAFRTIFVPEVPFLWPSVR